MPPGPVPAQGLSNGIEAAAPIVFRIRAGGYGAAMPAPDLRFPVRVVLPPSPRSVRVARELIRNLYVDTEVSADPDTVLLLVSELVSNAVLHAGQPCEMTVWLVGTTLRIAVTDPSPRSRESGTIPWMPVPDEDCGSSPRWPTVGVSPGAEQGPGRSVWFEFGRPVSMPELAMPADGGEPVETPTGHRAPTTSEPGGKSERAVADPPRPNPEHSPVRSPTAEPRSRR
jgi:hypothetical protein